MKLLADESVDGPIVVRLRQAGHQVLYVAEMSPGIPDDAVLATANEQAAILLTCDKDFGELVFRQGRLAAGVILVRLAGLAPRHKAEVVATAIGEYQDQLLGAFSVIMPGVMRIRQRLSGT